MQTLFAERGNFVELFKDLFDFGRIEIGILFRSDHHAVLHGIAERHPHAIARRNAFRVIFKYFIGLAGEYIHDYVDEHRFSPNKKYAPAVKPEHIYVVY